MLYHVIHRPLHLNPTNSSNQSRNNRQRSGSVPPSTLMPRYHYSRIVPNSATNNSDSLLTRNHFDNQTSKPSMTATTTTTSNNNNNNQNSYGSFKSTIIPLVTNNRTTTPNKREFIQIPITREDGTTNQTRSVPVTFITETNALPPTSNNNNNNENISPKPTFTNLLRPSSRYFQYHFNNSTEEPALTTATSSLPRLPSVPRRLSLTIPITTTVSTNTDDDTIKQAIPSSSLRQIPIRLPQASTTVASVPINTSRISSAILRSSPISNALQRQKTDIGDSASSSPALLTINNSQQPLSDFTVSTPIRRAEVMAREAIQGIARLQQQRNGSISENLNNRSPSPLSRRVIINLKNNQSVLLDSRLSSAMKPPPLPSSSSSRLTQRNNFYHIPILHEIQMPSHPTTILAESSFQSPSVNNNNNNGNYKNEFHMEIPVTITTNNDQENQIQQNDELINHERIPSANNNSNQTLKSILKRSSSRETVSRKNVSFMNA